MTDAEHQLETFLAPYPAEVQGLSWDCLKWTRQKFPGTTEVFWDATSAVCIAFSFTDHERDCFFNFAVFAKHVTIIFPWGISLNDPEFRLKGEGKRVRNIRMSGMDTLHDPYVEGLIYQAASLGVQPDERVEPRQIVKVMNGPKRRPN